MTSRPKRVRDLGSPYTTPSPIVRGDTDPASNGHAAPAPAYAREPSTRQRRDRAARQVELAGRALASGLATVAERRAALADVIAIARAAQVPDNVLRANLIGTGLLDDAEVDAALATT